MIVVVELLPALKSMISIGDTTVTKNDIRTYVRSFDVAAYAKTRNHLSGTVSRLSPYLTRGVCTLPEVASWVLENNSWSTAEKFIQELAWREYWQQVWFAKGEAIFTDVRFSRSDWQHSELVSALVEAKTGIQAIDASVTDLYQTGYMHNQARLWTAMLACNVAKAHWYDMSRWLYYHLLDGDLASNTLSWQWVAGTNAGKRHVANQALINACADTVQTGTYLDQEREAIESMSIPPVLAKHVPFQYRTLYPASDVLPALTGAVYLYSPWTLDADWRAGETGVRMLVIEPRWFDRFPVSESVLAFICEVAKTQIPNLYIHVGNVSDLPLDEATAVFSKSYPATQDWPGQIDQPARLYPEVMGYYPSFFKFWQACQNATITI